MKTAEEWLEERPITARLAAGGPGRRQACEFIGEIQADAIESAAVATRCLRAVIEATEAHPGADELGEFHRGFGEALKAIRTIVFAAGGLDPPTTGERATKPEAP